MEFVRKFEHWTSVGVDASLFRDGDDYFTVVSYSKVLSRETPTCGGRSVTETLAYSTDRDGRFLDSMPKKASRKIEDHEKFVRDLT